jgi:hypothetical protein
MRTKWGFGFALLCLLYPASAFAQDIQPNESTRGYVFAGLGSVNGEDNILHVGGGTELRFYKGLGMGLELGYAGPTCCMGEGIGTLSIDGQYTFGGSVRKLRPFLTGGYTLAFRDGHANALNFGGGVHYWFSRRVGLRLEFRDHVSPSVWTAHLWQGRVGFDFR